MCDYQKSTNNEFNNSDQTLLVNGVLVKKKEIMDELHLTKQCYIKQNIADKSEEHMSIEFL